MQIFQKALEWHRREFKPYPLHLIESKGWVPLKDGPITNQYEVNTTCSKNFVIEKRDAISEYDRLLHRKELCEECVNVFKSRLKK